MKTISFKTNEAETRLITSIVERTVAISRKSGLNYEKMDCRMDITACHANGNLLNLEKLAAFPDFDFCHDVFGIRRHLDRETGKLQNCFSPRCSV